MRYAALCIPLFLASMVFAFIPGAQAFMDRPTVAVPSPDNFVVGSIAGEPPRTRYFDFVVSVMIGAPDGFTKPMLVVNGQCMS